jgi:hypothetical protein
VESVTFSFRFKIALMQRLALRLYAEAGLHQSRHAVRAIKLAEVRQRKLVAHTESGKKFAGEMR